MTNKLNVTDEVVFLMIHEIEDMTEKNHGFTRNTIKAMFFEFFLDGFAFDYIEANERIEKYLPNNLK